MYHAYCSILLCACYLLICYCKCCLGCCVLRINLCYNSDIYKRLNEIFFFPRRRCKSLRGPYIAYTCKDTDVHTHTHTSTKTQHTHITYTHAQRISAHAYTIKTRKNSVEADMRRNAALFSVLIFHNRIAIDLDLLMWQGQI